MRGNRVDHLVAPADKVRSTEAEGACRVGHFG